MTETVQPEWLHGFTPQPNKPPKGWQADLKLIVDTCYAAILNCDDPAVRWQAARLLQNLGPMKGTLQ